jgi:hypothetical protein
MVLFEGYANRIRDSPVMLADVLGLKKKSAFQIKMIQGMVCADVDCALYRILCQ